MSQACDRIEIFKRYYGNSSKSQKGDIMVSNLRPRTIVTSGGRISIPKKIRDELSIKEGSVLELYIYKGKIVIEVLVT